MTTETKTNGKTTAPASESDGGLLSGKLVYGNGRDAAMLPVMPKQFSTGSRGWYGTGKAVIDGKAVQVTFSAVIIGSKPGGKKTS